MIARWPTTGVALGIVLSLVSGCSSGAGIEARRAEPVPPSSSTLPQAPDREEPGAPPTSDAGDGTSGHGTDDGVGDALFPELGNPGLDVTSYDVQLAYDPATDVVEGTVTLSVMPTEDREQFTLDAVELDVAEVLVDGAPARFDAEPAELRIRPESPLVAGTPVEVTVEWSCDPSSRISAAGLPNGWFDTVEGSYVLNEPDGLRTWMPANDHPSDKATWRFAVSVPEGLTAVANGTLVDERPDGDDHTWIWEERTPMATYLVQLLTGKYTLVESIGTATVALSSAVLTSDVERMRPHIDGIPEQIEFFERNFGPYPFERYGIAVTDSAAGLAMEHQGRSMLSRSDLLVPADNRSAQYLLSHELAHQWFGNAVTPATWRDIWLNEAFATYGQWMWFEHKGWGTVDEQAQSALEVRRRGSTATPDLDDMFGFNSYDGGAVVLHALRVAVGDEAFFETLRRWAADNVGESRSTSEFVALAENVSGRGLTELFEDWLYADQVPDAFPGSPPEPLTAAATSS